MTALKSSLGLRLAKLPERTPVKLTITLDHATHALLTAYAEAYRNIYVADDQLNVLIPFMLKQFVESDRSFMRLRTARSQGHCSNPNEGE